MRLKRFEAFGLRERERVSVPFFESQVFKFEENKDQIIKWVKHIKEDSPWGFITPTYSIITNRGAKVGDAQRAGFTKEQEAKWKDRLSRPPFVTNGFWSELPINPSMTRRTGNDKTLNHYVTIEKTKDNIILFGKSIGSLYTKLKAISDKHRTPISFKTHSYLMSMLNDNDSLKIFYYDPAVADEIERAVDEWTAETGVRTSERTHKRGVDYRPNPAADKASWGQVLADAMDKEFEKVVRMHGDKYTNEQYYEWYKRELPEFLRRSTVKLK
jgi:hypothetical protein